MTIAIAGDLAGWSVQANLPYRDMKCRTMDDSACFRSPWAKERSRMFQWSGTI